MGDSSRTYPERSHGVHGMYIRAIPEGDHSVPSIERMFRVELQCPLAARMLASSAATKSTAGTGVGDSANSLFPAFAATNCSKASA